MQPDCRHATRHPLGRSPVGYEPTQLEQQAAPGCHLPQATTLPQHQQKQLRVTQKQAPTRATARSPCSGPGETQEGASSSTNCSGDSCPHWAPCQPRWLFKDSRSNSSWKPQGSCTMEVQKSSTLESNCNTWFSCHEEKFVLQIHA